MLPDLKKFLLPRYIIVLQDTELKVAILDLVTECVASQPSMSELFLSVRPRTASDKDSSHPTYALEPESCLHAVLELMDPENKQAAHTPPSLLQAAMALLRGLWVGRHDAALIALRSQKDFWKHLTKPLFKEVSLEDSNGDTAVSSSSNVLCVQCFMFGLSSVRTCF